jgi:O-antigen/teichoic acid export membrane protein
MKQVVKNIFIFFISTFLARVAGFLRTFFVANLLGPSNYGLWVTLLIIPRFAPILVLGAGETMMKEYPYYTGKGQMEKAKTVEELTYCTVLIAVSFLGFFVFLNNIFPLARFGFDINYFLIIAAATSLNMITTFYLLRYMAHQDFKTISYLNVFMSVIGFVIIVSATYLGGFMGTVAGYFLNESLILLAVVIMAIYTIGLTRPKFSWKGIVHTIKVGLPITLIWWIFMIFTTVDRIVAITFLGKASTGYYGLGVSLYASMMLIPEVVGRVLYTKITEGLGKNISPEDLADIVVKPTRVLSLMMTFIIGIAIIVLPKLYITIFPKYLPGLVSAQILLLSSFFLSIIRNGINYMVSTDNEKTVIGLLIFSIGVNVSLNYVFIRAGYGINGIALATLISSAILTTGIWLKTYSNLNFEKKNVRKNILDMYYPIIAMSLIIAALMTFKLYVFNDSVLWYVLSIIFVTLSYMLVILGFPTNRALVGEITTGLLKFRK